MFARRLCALSVPLGANQFAPSKPFGAPKCEKLVPKDRRRENLRQSLKKKACAKAGELFTLHNSETSGYIARLKQEELKRRLKTKLIIEVAKAREEQKRASQDDIFAHEDEDEEQGSEEGEELNEAGSDDEENGQGSDMEGKEGKEEDEEEDEELKKESKEKEEKEERGSATILMEEDGCEEEKSPAAGTDQAPEVTGGEVSASNMEASPASARAPGVEVKAETPVATSFEMDVESLAQPNVGATGVAETARQRLDETGNLVSAVPQRAITSFIGGRPIAAAPAEMGDAQEVADTEELSVEATGGEVVRGTGAEAVNYGEPRKAPDAVGEEGDANGDGDDEGGEEEEEEEEEEENEEAVDRAASYRRMLEEEAKANKLRKKVCSPRRSLVPAAQSSICWALCFFVRLTSTA